MVRLPLLILFSLYFSTGIFAQEMQGTVRYKLKESQRSRLRILDTEKCRFKPTYLGYSLGLHGSYSTDPIALIYPEKPRLFHQLDLVHIPVIYLRQGLYITTAISAQVILQKQKIQRTYQMRHYGLVWRSGLEIYLSKRKSTRINLSAYVLRGFSEIKFTNEVGTILKENIIFSDFQHGVRLGLFFRNFGLYGEVSPNAKRGVFHVKDQAQWKIGVQISGFNSLL
jgi:hypothetical protein